MSFLHYVKTLFSLDTLDTRFTSSRISPNTRPQIDPAKPPSSDPPSLPARSSGASPSKWRTPEFFVYYLVFILAVPMMFKVSYDVSKPSHPNFPKYEALLSPGWILGRKVDNSDNQYSSFRDNIPYMFILLILHPLLRKTCDYIFFSGRYPSNSAQANGHAYQGPHSSAADSRLSQRVNFDVYFALLFLCALHGFSSLKVLLILYLNFILGTRLPRELVPTATWIFNIGILFANEFCHGYPYSDIATFITQRPAFPDADYQESKGWGSWLDAYGGLIPRWEVLFKMTVLRSVSFNLDYYWSLDRAIGSPAEKKQLDPANLSERERISSPAPHRDYSFRNYFAYTLYSPLYLAGPILTFNDYISQLRHKPSSVTTIRSLLYGIRFFISLLTMEIVLHFIYVVAIFKAHPAWELYTPFQLSMLGYFNLHIIWLKLLLPWRFFRFWALLDGIDPPENMVRCMSDNYSALAFWRGWHRSLNRWIVRYIYVPLGGSRRLGANVAWGKVRAGVNYLAVFTFVALWHDINLKLLMWGWLISLFVLPEVLAGYLFPKRKWQNRKEAYRIICGIGAVGNILMMMIANLVGFAIGLDGLKGLVQGIVGSYSGLVYVATACAALFVGVQVMFETREQELREGIKMMC